MDTIVSLSQILRTRYDEFAQQLESALQPVGLLELMTAARVIGDHQRALFYDAQPDQDNPSLERARHQNGLNLRRAMADLRQLQADRYLKAHLNLDLPPATRVKDVHQFLKLKQQPAAPPADRVADVEAKILAVLQKEEQLHAENLKKRSQFQNADTTQPADVSPQASNGRRAWPRNLPCPCGSGQKYKRCCAVGAPPAFAKAA